LGCHWAQEFAVWKAGSSGSDGKTGYAIAARHEAIICGEHAPPEKRKFLRKSQLWSYGFTAKLFCNVEFWLERLPKLIETQPEFERPVAARGSLLCGPSD
jgi:hypothetical protein